MTGAMQLAQQDLMQLIPDTGQLPIPEPSPTGHARAAAHLCGQHPPGDAALQDKHDPGQSGPVADPRPPTFCGPRRGWQQRFDHGPKAVRDKRGRHKPLI